MSEVSNSRRFVDVTPAGVLNWLSRPERSLERDLVERLLWRDPAIAIHFQTLADSVQHPLPEVARAMFALNRRHELLVEVDPPATPPGQGLQETLLQDATTLCSAHHTPLVLAGGDGLCLLRLNCDATLAENAAARFGPCGELRATTALHYRLDRITVFAGPSLDLAHPVWVSLARNLLRFCGALSFGGN